MDYEEAVRESTSLIEKAIPLLVRDNTGGTAPTYKRADSTELNNEYERLKASRDITQANIDIDQQRISSATEEEKAAIRAKGVAEGEGAQADRIKSERDAALFAQYAEIFSITPSKVAEVVGRMNKERPLIEASAREIKDMQSITPFDNLLEWWGNQIKLPGKIQAHNTEAAMYNTMQDTLDGYISTADKVSTFAHKGLPTITAAQAKAKADQAAADAAKASAQADINLAKTSVDFATKKFATDVAVAGQTLHTTQLEIAQNTKEFEGMIHAIQFADNHADRLLNAGKLLETIAKNEDEMAQRKQIQVLLKNYDLQTGKPEGTTNYNVWRNLPQVTREDMVAIGSGSFGPSPLQAAVKYYRSNPGPLRSPETERLMSYIRTKGQEVHTTVAGMVGLNEAQKIEKTEKTVNEQIAQDISSASRPGNVFYELSPARMMEAAQMNRDSIVAKVLTPLIEKKDSNIPTELVVLTIASAFKNPNDAAAAISDYYSRNMNLRNTAMNAKAARIDLPTTYSVDARLGPLTTAKLDLTKADDALKYLLVKAHEERMAKMPFLGSGIGGFR